MNLKTIEDKIDAQMSEQAEISEQRKDSANYSKALETTDKERTRLQELINELPLIDGYDWGPRSAHVVSKKYLLLKTLWASLEAHDTTDPERLQLVDPFFDTMHARLDARRAADTEEEKVVRMRKVAQYVV